MKKVLDTRHALISRPARVLALTVMLSALGGMVQTTHAAPGMMGAGQGGMHAAGAGPGERGLGNARMLDRMLDSVNATAEQRAQIKPIAALAQTDLRAWHEQGAKLHQQSQALFTKPTVDAGAAEALRFQMSALHDLGSKRRLQMMMDISRVLTPEQRQKLAERMNQRRTMMERHRSEREALDKPVLK